MTAINWRGRIWHALCMLCLVLALAACDTGSNDPPETDPPGTGPNIFGLSKSSVNIGEALSIIGSNFGTVQGSGQVTLGDIGLLVTAWNNNQIDVTVPSGAQSGIVAVTQNGVVSESGQEAQLFIGQAPSATPVILSVTPAAARAGQQEISIVGSGFGSPDTGSVLFATADGGTIAGTIVTNTATGEPQWTATNIRVLVPAEARSGAIFVNTANGPSNPFILEVLPPQIDLDNIRIDSVSPSGGPSGTILEISGDNFGQFQGNSRAVIQSGGNTYQLLVQEWTNNLIRASIPLGAQTGTLHLLISGRDVTFDNPIVVALNPEITAVMPSDMRIGRPVRLLGDNFGDEAGSLKFGNTDIPASAITLWSDEEIMIDALPPITLPTPGDNSFNIVLTTALGLVSDPFSVNLVSDLIGSLTVSPKTGIAGKTEFTFTVNAAGEEGARFKYTLIPDMDNPAVTVVSNPTPTESANPQIIYKYPQGGKTFRTGVRIEDVNTGDFILVTDNPNTVQAETPLIFVGGPSDVVIVDFAPLNFAQGAFLGENINTFPPVLAEYNDFVITPQFDAPFDFWFNTAVDDLSVNGNATQFQRKQSDFLYGSPKQRPYGYRRTNVGGLMRIHGWNFGSSGSIRLNATDNATGTAVGTYVGTWNHNGDGITPSTTGEGYIDFELPLTNTNLGGKIVVINGDSQEWGISAEPLIVSAFLPGGNIGPVSLVDPDPAARTVTIVGNDLSAPESPGISGEETRLFWVVRASFPDPFDTNDPPATRTEEVLVMNPYPVDVVNNTQISFDIASIDVDPVTAGVQANIEAPSADFTDYRPAVGTLEATPTGSDYYVFLWTGVLPNNGTIGGQALANAGVMSDRKTVRVTNP